MECLIQNRLFVITLQWLLIENFINNKWLSDLFKLTEEYKMDNLNNATETGFDNRFEVDSKYLVAPFNAQTLILNSGAKHLVMPAELGYMRTGNNKGHFSMKYSRTGMPLLMVPEENKIVLIKDSAITNLYGKTLKQAHETNQECLIPKEERALVYDFVKHLEKIGLAKSITPGSKTLSGKLDEEITEYTFSDDAKGIRSTDYGKTITGMGYNTINMFLDDLQTMGKQEGMYLNIVRVGGPGSCFLISSYNRNLGNNGGAFGVCFKPAEGSAQNLRYTSNDAQTLRTEGSNIATKISDIQNSLNIIKNVHEKL